MLPSFLISKLPFQQWYAEICLCGVRRIAYSMSKMSRVDNQLQWWEAAFCTYWSLLVKYFIPSVLWILLVGNTKADIDNTYGGYASHWQAIGMVVPILGLISFFVNVCFWLHEEQMDPVDFKERFDKDFTDPWETDAPGASEMAGVNKVSDDKAVIQ
jgi:hypothetical protein